MATVVGSGANGDYDLGRGLAMYDLAGDLPLRARELWSYLADDSAEIAREFWVRYAKSPEVRDVFDSVVGCDEELSLDGRGDALVGAEQPVDQVVDQVPCGADERGRHDLVLDRLAVGLDGHAAVVPHRTQGVPTWPRATPEAHPSRVVRSDTRGRGAFSAPVAV